MHIFICSFFYLVWLGADICWLSSIVSYRTSAYLTFLFIVYRQCSTQLLTSWKNNKKWTKWVCTRWMNLHVTLQANYMPKFGSLMKVMNNEHSHFGTIMKSSSSETILIFTPFCLYLGVWCLLAMIWAYLMFFSTVHRQCSTHVQQLRGWKNREQQTNRACTRCVKVHVILQVRP